MTEQPPSAEALEIADGQPLAEALRLSLAREIDALIAQRVSAETERCAGIADLYADTPPSGDHNNTPQAFAVGMDHRAGAVDCALCIARMIRAPAERPAPEGPQPHDYNGLICKNCGQKYGGLTSTFCPTTALASTGEQPASPAAVVGYTHNRTALELLDPVAGKLTASEWDRLFDGIAAALSAVASEHQAAAIRAFGQRVWSDTDEVAYQAGVSDTRARLREPDEAMIAAIQEAGSNVGGPMPASIARAVIARIAEMLK